MDADEVIIRAMHAVVDVIRWLASDESVEEIEAGSRKRDGVGSSAVAVGDDDGGSDSDAAVVAVSSGSCRCMNCKVLAEQD